MTTQLCDVSVLLLQLACKNDILCNKEILTYKQLQHLFHRMLELVCILVNRYTFDST